MKIGDKGRTWRKGNNGPFNMTVKVASSTGRKEKEKSSKESKATDTVKGKKRSAKSKLQDDEASE